MDEPMTKARLIDVIRTSRAEWDALLSQVDEARMARPGVAGDWSVKDIVAHITWHEREMIGLLRARALVGSNLWDCRSTNATGRSMKRTGIVLWTT